MTIRIDYDRAESLFGTLIRARANQEYPYNVSKPPQQPENLPENIFGDEIALARFLFITCYYMRGGIESDTAFLALTRLYKYHPRLFDPNTFTQTGQADCLEDYTAERIVHILQAHNLAYSAEQISKQWVFNATKLALHWEGNPIKLFADIEGVEGYKILCDRIIHRSSKPNQVRFPHGFSGFQEKMASMLAYFFMDCKLVPSEAFPVPVDFHVMRLLAAHEVLSNDAVPLGDNLLTPEFQAAARELTSGYCVANDLDIVDLSDALWLFSRAMCYNNPGNIVAVKKRDGRKSELVPPVINWNKTQLKKYWGACGRCPVQDTCNFDVPSGYYYVLGLLIRLARRQKPPDLFGGKLIP